MPKSDWTGGVFWPLPPSPLNVSFFSHLTPIGVRENEKISRLLENFS